MKRNLLCVAIGLIIMSSIGPTFAMCYYWGESGGWGGWHYISSNEQENDYTCGLGCGPIMAYTDCGLVTQTPTKIIIEWLPSWGNWGIIDYEGSCQDSVTIPCGL